MTTTMTRKVDTAALAAALKCEPSYIRWLARKGVITPLCRARVGPTGRPAMWFDLDTACDAVEVWRGELDQHVCQVRK